MTSIFSLKTSPSQLESTNNGISRFNMQQISTNRNVTGDSFPNGPIDFRFSTVGETWWIPSRSYLRARVRLTKADGTQLV